MRTFEDKFLRKHGVSLKTIAWRSYVRHTKEEEARPTKRQAVVGRIVTHRRGFFSRVWDWFRRKIER